eukprot:CAMPEP_0174756766 /NCGR_PEP_ID=MMETSP1094-20130205/106921_1 /TAXON_ID=156173 /ORGANISM="Chrysochromulina brevifilum, Strain UTEX LB 985" /LENGTH=792 /DNA_ID=CAMNT_0015962677 /DNA_START=21 /DNA_END=2399 /DNA_ORIENTATION=-
MKDDGQLKHVSNLPVKRSSTLSRFYNLSPKRVPNGQSPSPDASFVRDYYHIKEMLRIRARERQGVFTPGESKFLNRWDMLSAAMLMYTALVTPFTVVFSPPATSASELLFVVDRIVDMFYVFDLALQFFIAAPIQSETKTTLSPSAIGIIWSYNRADIAKHYLKTWFTFDVLTIAPSIFDILPLVIDLAGDLSSLELLRVFRILRFIKILRFVRSARVFQRVKARIPVSYGTQIVSGAIFKLVIAAHWFACIFALQASLHQSAQDTWLGEGLYHYCSVDEAEATRPRTMVAESGLIIPAPGLPPISPSPPPPTPKGILSFEEEKCSGISIAAWYLASFSWSVMIITGTGGTDFYPSSRSQAETTVVLLLNFIGAILWTGILADFCDVATNAGPRQTLFRQTLDDMNRFLDYQDNVPISLRTRMRVYLYASQELSARIDSAKSLTFLSPVLQAEVYMIVHSKFFDRVWYLRNAGKHICVQVVLRMRSLVMAPGEVAPLGKLYKIERGHVAVRGQLLTSGLTWGVDDILLTDALQKYASKHRALAMGYADLQSLSREDFRAVIANDPYAKRLMRKYAIWVALRRFIVGYANEHAKANKTMSLLKQLDFLTGRGEENMQEESAVPSLPGPASAQRNAWGGADEIEKISAATSLIHTTPSANVPTEAFQQEVLATLSKHEAEVKAMRSDVQQVHAKLDELFGLLRPKSNEVRRERSHRSQSRSPVGGERLTSVVKAAGQASRNGGTDGRPLSAPAQQGSQRNWETARRRMRTGEKVRKVGGQTAQRGAEYTANRLA